MRPHRILLVLGGALCLLWLAGTSSDILRDAQSGARMTEVQDLKAARQSAAPSPEPSLYADTPMPAPTEAVMPTATLKPAVLPELAPLLAKNPDLAGWLSIEGTVIDYPVMFTPGDEDFYLTHDFDRQPDKNGSLLIQAGCDPFTPGRNIIIHGHNMKSGKMFGSLGNYRKKSFWKAHPIIHFDTLYKRGEYEVMAVFPSKVYRQGENAFKYYRFFQADTQAEFDDFVSNIRRLALYDTGVTASFGDTFITLSTCAYHTEDGRLAVVARKK